MDAATRSRLEQIRRSIVMLRSNQPALNRDDALEVFRVLQETDRELRRLREGLEELLRPDS